MGDRYRVVQWGTGHVGRHALATIIGHPALELVGVIVSDPNKVGRDAGDLGGLAPTGVRANDDIDAVLALAPDCVCYTATADLRPAEAVADLCRVLERGINVVSSSIVPLVYPPAVDAWLREPLAEACTRGGSSCFTSGIDPGFANDVLPLVLSGFGARVDRLRVSEILNYATYDQPTVLFDTMGFGQPLDATPMLLLPGVLAFAWGGALHAMGAGIGARFDDVREVVERRATDVDLSLPAGDVTAGTMGALRFEVQGIVAGEPVVVIEHVTRLADDIAPDWPQPVGAGSYRIEVAGSPRMICDLQLVGEDGDHNTGGLVATAARILNAVPAVCAAEPGLLSALDLPLVTGPFRS